MKYGICWKDKATGVSNRGKPIFNSREEIQEFVDELNRDFPLLYHWVESTKRRKEMSEQTVRERLDLLIALEATLAELEEEKAQAVEAIIPHEVREHIKQIETEFADQIHAANANIASIKVAIKNAVLTLGGTIKGTGYMAVWSKGRVTWDSKGLDGYMVAHPEVKAFRKEGKPSVSIRRRK